MTEILLGKHTSEFPEKLLKKYWSSVTLHEGTSEEIHVQSSGWDPLETHGRIHEIISKILWENFLKIFQKRFRKTPGRDLRVIPGSISWRTSGRTPEINRKNCLRNIGSNPGPKKLRKDFLGELLEEFPEVLTEKFPKELSEKKKKNWENLREISGRNKLQRAPMHIFERIAGRIPAKTFLRETCEKIFTWDNYQFLNNFQGVHLVELISEKKIGRSPMKIFEENPEKKLWRSTEFHEQFSEELELTSQKGTIARKIFRES